MDVLRVIDGFDIDDAYCRVPPVDPATARSADIHQFTFGRIGKPDLQWFGMDECSSLYEEACDRVVQIGGQPTEIDYVPFSEAGKLLFDGPWIAERRSALEPFASGNPDALLGVIDRVLKVADKFSAVQTFDGMHRLASNIGIT